MSKKSLISEVVCGTCGRTAHIKGSNIQLVQEGPLKGFFRHTCEYCEHVFEFEATPEMLRGSKDSEEQGKLFEGGNKVSLLTIIRRIPDSDCHTFHNMRAQMKDGIESIEPILRRCDSLEYDSRGFKEEMVFNTCEKFATEVGLRELFNYKKRFKDRDSNLYSSLIWHGRNGEHFDLYVEGSGLRPVISVEAMSPEYWKSQLESD